MYRVYNVRSVVLDKFTRMRECANNSVTKVGLVESKLLSLVSVRIIMTSFMTYSCVARLLICITFDRACFGIAGLRKVTRSLEMLMY